MSHTSLAEAIILTQLMLAQLRQTFYQVLQPSCSLNIQKGLLRSVLLTELQKLVRSKYTILFKN